MSDPTDNPTEVHKHYHMWPGSDCSCAGVIIIFMILVTIESLAKLDKLPW